MRTGTLAGSRLPSLGGLRGVMSLAVLLCHMGYMSAIFVGPVNATLASIVHLAVGIVSGFFTLSGFVLAWQHVPRDTAHAFWRRRLVRVVPTYVLAWVAAMTFFAVSTTAPATLIAPEHNATTSIATLFLVQCWIPNLNVCTGVNPPAWSLCCEAFFYAVFPVLIVLARKISATKLNFAWLATAALTLAMPLIAETIKGPRAYPWLPVPATAIWFVQAFPPVRLLEFLLGILTAQLVLCDRWPRGSLPVGVAMLIAAIAAIPALPPLYAQGAAISIPLCVIVGGLAAKDILNRSGFLARPAMVQLGNASYALYITHFPLLMIVRTAVRGWEPFSLTAGLLIFLGLTTSAVTMALLLYHYFERPLAARWSRPRRPPRQNTSPDTTPDTAPQPLNTTK
jgi:peptidoglycan/LPS O-acetylase OafA/YrhL